MKNVQEGLRTSCRWFVAAAAVVSMIPVAHAAGIESTSAPAPKSIFATSVASPTDNLTYGAMNYGVSSSSADAALDERASLGEGFNPNQPPPRRRTYGRPRYSDKWHNSDGSSKLAFEFGGGMNIPAGATGHYQTPGWKISVGGGLNFNKAFGVLLQFDYDNMGVPREQIQAMQQFYLDNGATTDDVAGMDASTHLWSLTLNPVINFQGSGRAGAYLVGGAGYYRKITSFTLPATGCDPNYYYYYGICVPVTMNQEFDRYTSGAFGVNGGVGLTWKLSSFSSQRLFAEARYVWTNNKPDNGLLYPPNSYRTGYFPVTVGLRW